MAKIIVVDDSETQRFQMRQDLMRDSHEVIEAKDGLDGLEKIEQNHDVKLIICDVNMPNMDGVSMCSKLYERGTFRHVPIFMLTTEASPELKASAKMLGVVAWIRKPYVADKLLAAVKKVISK